MDIRKDHETLASIGLVGLASLTHLSPEDTPIRDRALVRAARERLDRIEERREIANLMSRGRSQRQIAELLLTTQPRVHRIQKALERTGSEVPETTEEIILRATVDGTSRHDLVERLKQIRYTLGESAPYPVEGRTRGTWDDIVSAFFEGLLSEPEVEEIRASSGA